MYPLRSRIYCPNLGVGRGIVQATYTNKRSSSPISNHRNVLKQDYEIVGTFAAAAATAGRGPWPEGPNLLKMFVIAGIDDIRIGALRGVFTPLKTVAERLGTAVALVVILRTETRFPAGAQWT